MSNDDKAFMTGYALIGVFIMTLFAAWGTHVVTCLSDERWGFLIAGAFAAPVAVIHGFGIWLGVW